MAQQFLEQERTPFQKFIQKRGIYIAMAATFFGLFAGIPIIIWFITVTIISVGKLFILLFLCGAVGIFQWKHIRDHVELEYHQFAMYAFSGFGMCLLNFLMLLNFFIPIHSHSETINVQAFNLHVNYGNYEVDLNDAALARNLNTYLNDHFDKIPDFEKVTISYETGLLGFDMITDCKFH